MFNTLKKVFKMSLPLVTVVCLCYNHADYIQATLNSVFDQTYPHIEIIIVDSGSTDNSTEVIQEIVQAHPEITFIPIKENIGNCSAFNKALSIAKGEYIIDLATDDVMLKNRVTEQVACFEFLENNYAVVFTDSYFIDEKGNRINSTYYSRNEEGILNEEVESGDVYKRLLSNPPLISAPTQMFRTSHLKNVGGYDESLSYEDYDIWVRLGRKYLFHFLDSITTEKRILPRSSSKLFYNKRQNPHLDSTLKVCHKALAQNRNKEENKALAKSVRYHARLSLFTENFKVGLGFYDLLKKLDTINKKDMLLYQLLKNKVRLNWIYSLFRN